MVRVQNETDCTAFRIIVVTCASLEMGATPGSIRTKRAAFSTLMVVKRSSNDVDPEVKGQGGNAKQSAAEKWSHRSARVTIGTCESPTDLEV